MNNGSNGAELATPAATFADCGYVFRHYEDCQLSYMRWQAGRNITDTIELADGSGLLIERIEWAESAEGSVLI